MVDGTRSDLICQVGRTGLFSFFIGGGGRFVSCRSSTSGATKGGRVLCLVSGVHGIGGDDHSTHARATTQTETKTITHHEQHAEATAVVYC